MDSIEITILKNLIYNEDFCRKVIPFIKSEYFEDTSQNIIFEEIVKFITKYDKAVATKHFIDNGDGTLRVTKAEGFVAVDHTENGIKLVDRLEFSKNNFNSGKPGS